MKLMELMNVVRVHAHMGRVQDAAAVTEHKSKIKPKFNVQTN
jgi:hypothetical protein